MLCLQLINCCACIAALVLLVQRLDSDDLAAFCLESLAEKVVKHVFLHIGGMGTKVRGVRLVIIWPLVAYVH